MGVLFDEAIEALNFVEILEKESGNSVMNKLLKVVPFTTTGCGKVDWERIKNYQSLNTIEELTDFNMVESDDKCFIIWNEATKPIIKTNIDSIINAFDDVTAVSFDTWIFIPKNNCIIENTGNSLKIATL